MDPSVSAGSFLSPASTGLFEIKDQVDNVISSTWDSGMYWGFNGSIDR